MHYCRDQVSVLALVDDNMAAQEAALRDKADVLVATPARLVAHLKAGNVELKDTVCVGVVDVECFRALVGAGLISVAVGGGVGHVLHFTRDQHRDFFCTRRRQAR